jgi:outer membrane protein assembly factor BamB
MEKGERMAVYLRIKNIILTLFLCVVVFSCPPAVQQVTRSETLADSALESGNAAVTYREALITFVSGEVYVKGEADWEYVEIGNIVHPGEIIKVGADSLCELQFGQDSVVRIQENSEVALKDFWLEPDKSKVDVNLEVGSVLCKVSKLSGEESFKVRTRTAVCGIRGTEFMVRVSDANDTVLAVKEGAVTIVPESADTDTIEQQADINDNGIKALVKKLEDSAVVVKANQEVTINEQTADRTRELVQNMVAEVRKADTKAEVTDKDLDSVSLLVTATTVKIRKVLSPPAQIPAENEKELKALDGMEIKEIMVVPETGSENKTEENKEESVPALIKIKVNALPQDADIYLDNQLMGKGRYQGLYQEGKTLHFTISKPGFKTQALTLETNKSAWKEFNITLQELSGKEKEEETKAAASAKQRQDELNKTVALKDKGTEKKPAAIPREKVPLKVVKVAPSGFVNELVPAGGLLTAADTGGAIYALDKDGNIVWSQNTANNPNHNSWPAAGGGYLYFAGSRELDILRVDTGKIIGRRNLGSAENQMFGRRLVVWGDAGLFATDNSLQLVDLKTGDPRKEYAVPGGSLMTPAIYKGTAYLVNLTGQLVGIDLQSGAADAHPLQTRALGPVALPLAINGNKAYFCGRKGILVCVDLDNKKILWQKKLDPASNVYPHQEMIVQGRGVYVFAGDKIYAFSAANGGALFTPLAGATAAPLYLEGKLYFGRNDGVLVVADANTGGILRLIEIDAHIISRPFAWDKRIVLATDRGNIIFADKVLR